ncbi:MAG TPA: exodeoxyribonuclease VII small subunit [Edaphocola sp.]|nr:exodeoxyribonuclease VII small subunit [Edaphocola sp.]
MPENNITYQQAFREVQEIIDEIESGGVSLDDLSEKVKRASFLMNICKQKLHATEQEIKGILDKLDTRDKD